MKEDGNEGINNDNGLGRFVIFFKCRWGWVIYKVKSWSENILGRCYWIVDNLGKWVLRG